MGRSDLVPEFCGLLTLASRLIMRSTNLRSKSKTSRRVTKSQLIPGVMFIRHSASQLIKQLSAAPQSRLADAGLNLNPMEINHGRTPVVGRVSQSVVM
jgi:hypothetical protein